jgi:membrane associated rhomboid family serine protease
MSSGPAGSSASPAQEQRCYRHPNREALVRCVRCDRPICPDCMRPASVGFHCPDDVALGRRSIRQQRTQVGAILRESPPYVTSALIALNIAVYVITGEQSTRGITDPTAGRIHSLFDRWQLQPEVVHQDGSYWRLLTSAFLHVSLLHIALNMFALFVIGPPVERLVGPARFLAIYLLSALGGGAAIYAFAAAGVPVVGASGAIFGLFGACLVMVRQLGLDLRYLVGTIVVNFVFTISIPGISKLGHLGGFIAGLLAGLAIAGLPAGLAGSARVARRVTPRLQVVGLAALGILELLVVVVRSAVGGF